MTRQMAIIINARKGTRTTILILVIDQFSLNELGRHNLISVTEVYYFIVWTIRLNSHCLQASTLSFPYINLHKILQYSSFISPGFFEPSLTLSFHKL